MAEHPGYSETAQAGGGPFSNHSGAAAAHEGKGGQAHSHAQPLPLHGKQSVKAWRQLEGPSGYQNPAFCLSCLLISLPIWGGFKPGVVALDDKLSA